MARKPAVDVVLEAAARARALLTADLIEIDARLIDDDRSRAFQVVHRGHEDLHDLGVGGIPLVRLTQNPDALALEPIRLQERGVVWNHRWTSLRG